MVEDGADIFYYRFEGECIMSMSVSVSHEQVVVVVMKIVRVSVKVPTNRRKDDGHCSRFFFSLSKKI